jgi:hypothetical protein
MPQLSCNAMKCVETERVGREIDQLCSSFVNTFQALDSIVWAREAIIDQRQPNYLEHW